MNSQRNGCRLPCLLQTVVRKKQLLRLCVAIAQSAFCQGYWLKDRRMWFESCWDTTTCFGPICEPSSGCDLTFQGPLYKMCGVFFGYWGLCGGGRDLICFNM